MGFFNKLTRKTGKAISKNAFEAAIAAGVLTSAADKKVASEELEKVETLIVNNDSFAAYKKPEIKAQISKFATLIKSDYRLGKSKLIKEIQDVADSGNHEDAQEVFITAVSVAEAGDEGVGKEEYAILVEIGGILGLHPKDFDVSEPA